MASRVLGVLFWFCSWGVATLILVEVFCFWIVDARIVAILEAIVGPICHHLPERTFRHPLMESPFPVCARCTGLYLGWLLGLSLGSGIQIQRPANAKCLLCSWLTVTGLAALAVLAAVSEAFGVFDTRNITRLLLGIPLGVLPAFALIAASRLLVGSAS